MLAEFGFSKPLCTSVSAVVKAEGSGSHYGIVSTTRNRAFPLIMRS
jgi:hypothetical protein